MKQEQAEQFDIVVQSKARHAILWELVERFNSRDAAAKEIGVSLPTFCAWLNLRVMPKTTRKRSARQKKAYLRLVQLTGRKLEDIFPGFVRERLGDIPRTHERRVSVNLVALTDARAVQLSLPAPESQLPSAEELVSQAELKSVMADLLRFLPKKERRVLELRFGLDGGYERTLKEVGQLLDPPVMQERVRQLEARALRRLQQYRTKRRLASFIPGREDA